MFRFVPGVLRFFRLLVFVYLEWTFRQFYLDKNATRLRNRAESRSRKYIEKTAPSTSQWISLMNHTLNFFAKGNIGIF